MVAAASIHGGGAAPKGVVPSNPKSTCGHGDELLTAAEQKGQTT